MCVCSHTRLVANHKDILTLFLSLLLLLPPILLDRHTLTVAHALTRIKSGLACPLVQRLGHLPLEQVIGVRIPGGQPKFLLYSCGYSEVPHLRPCPILSLSATARLVSLRRGVHAPQFWALWVLSAPNHLRVHRALPEDSTTVMDADFARMWKAAIESHREPLSGD
jgi:hypothetical protein